MKKAFFVTDIVLAIVSLLLCISKFNVVVQLSVFAVLSLTVIVLLMISSYKKVPPPIFSVIIIIAWSISSVGATETPIWFDMVAAVFALLVTVVFVKPRKRTAFTIIVVFVSAYIFFCGFMLHANKALSREQDVVIEKAIVQEKYISGKFFFYTYSFDVDAAKSKEMNVVVSENIYNEVDIGEEILIKRDGRFFSCYDFFKIP